MKAENPQLGNPHKLTFWQHVFPARSVRRFAGLDGNVAVKHRLSKQEFRLSPSDKLFCAKRAWDQRAEGGYMKEIENEFHTLAEEVISGLRTTDSDKSRIVTRFFALWFLRHQHRHSPTPDHSVGGVAVENLSKDQEEMLEKNFIGYFRAGEMMPGRSISGLKIQMAIDRFEIGLRGTHWGLVAAREGEFLLPDTFGKFAVVPITPTICLRCGREDVELSVTEVARLNRLAVQSAKDYCVARDFTMCPL